MEITTGTTADESVVADPERHGPVRLRRDVRNKSVLAVAIVSLFVVGANYLVLPYYAIAPGSALDTAPLITVPDKAHYHPAKGQVLLTTVSLGKVTLLQALQGWLDPAVDVVKEQVIAPPNVDESELRQINLDLMDESKKKAIGVAFEALGVDAIKGKGVEVVAVVPGTPADGTLAVGDTIVAIDGTPTSIDFEAAKILGAHEPGDTVVLSVVPKAGADARSVEAVLMEHPEVPGRAFLGVSLSTRDLSFDFPFDVELASERIGGPSAGLAFTLEVLDVLTEGELTGGHKIAVTGTIELDGSVGEVGGVAQKTVAVKRAGAELFLVPSGEYEAAKRFAGKDLRIEVADSLDDALRVLATLGGNGLALPVIDAGISS